MQNIIDNDGAALEGLKMVDPHMQSSGNHAVLPALYGVDCR